MTTRTDHDVVVAGGRVAGAATARLLAAQGYDVVVLERATPYRDTLSTHGLSRGGVVQLARWGLLERLLAGGAPPIRAVTFARPGEAVTRQVKDRAGVDLLLAPRRWALDALLADAAVEAGARVETRTTVTDLLRGPDGRVTGVRATGTGSEHEYHARLVVGADGLRSTVARLTGARLLSESPSGAALFYAYVGEVAWPAMEFHLVDRGYGGAFPTHGAEACVWLTRPIGLLQDVTRAGADRAAAWLSALAEVAPDLARRVGGGRISSPVRGWVAPPGTVRQAQGPGWALVGDAGSFRDPITGHGITDALRDAELLADAAHRALSGEEPTALAGYQHARDTAAADVLRITGELSRFPDPDRFVELQLELSAALDREATELASRPAPAGRHAATAA